MKRRKSRMTMTQRMRERMPQSKPQRRKLRQTSEPLFNKRRKVRRRKPREIKTKKKARVNQMPSDVYPIILHHNYLSISGLKLLSDISKKKK